MGFKHLIEYIAPPVLEMAGKNYYKQLGYGSINVALIMDQFID